jgi:prevent-host-death family protein
MNKRQAVSEMMRRVEAGEAFTIEADGEPVAIVVPWEHWANFTANIKKLSEAPAQ